MKEIPGNIKVEGGVTYVYTGTEWLSVGEAALATKESDLKGPMYSTSLLEGSYSFEDRKGEQFCKMAVSKEVISITFGGENIIITKDGTIITT